MGLHLPIVSNALLLFYILLFISLFSLLCPLLFSMPAVSPLLAFYFLPTLTSFLSSFSSPNLFSIHIIPSSLFSIFSHFPFAPSLKSFPIFNPLSFTSPFPPLPFLSSLFFFHPLLFFSPLLFLSRFFFSSLLFLSSSSSFLPSSFFLLSSFFLFSSSSHSGSYGTGTALWGH